MEPTFWAYRVYLKYGAMDTKDKHKGVLPRMPREWRREPSRGLWWPDRLPGGGGNWLELWRECKTQEKVRVSNWILAGVTTFPLPNGVYSPCKIWASAEGAAVKPMACSWSYHDSPSKVHTASFFSAQEKNLKMPYLLAACWFPDAVYYSDVILIKEGN